MKTKTRNIIGNVLIWGGLTAYVIQVIYLFYSAQLNADATMWKTALGNTTIIIALLVGGLWGMRRK